MILRDIPLDDLVDGTALRDITLSTLVEGTALRDIPLDTDIGGGASSPAYMEVGLYDRVTGADEWHIAFLPAGYDDPANSSRVYKTIYWYGGDGADDGTGGDNPPALVTNQAMSGSGTGPYTTTFTNTQVASRPTREVGWGTVIVKVSGVEVARGRSDGTITGTGVTGTMAHQSAEGAVSITFDSTPGASPTIDYYYSSEFEAGIPKFINDGDELDDDTIVIMVHKAANDTNFLTAGHWDDVLTEVEPLYRVNTNKRIVAGLSRGAFFGRELLLAKHTQIAAWLLAAPNSGGTFTSTNYYKKGIYVVCGQTDSTATPPISGWLFTTTADTSYELYPYFTLLQNVGHTATIWNTNMFNRSTATFDYLQWASLWDLDHETQCDNFVTRAEETESIDDYRVAARAVSFMSAGSPKTALEGRLSTLKSTIDGGRKRWYIDAGGTTTGQSWINDATSFSTGTTYSDLNDDNGGSTSVGFQIVAQMDNGGTGRVATNARAGCPGFGFAREQYFDYARLDLGNDVTNGSVKWTGLDPLKTYKVVLYGLGPTTSIANDIFIAATTGGTTKSIFTTYTNTSKLEFTGLSPNGSNEIVLTDVSNPGGTTTGAIQVFMLEEEN